MAMTTCMLSGHGSGRRRLVLLTGLAVLLAGLAGCQFLGVDQAPLGEQATTFIQDLARQLLAAFVL